MKQVQVLTLIVVVITAVGLVYYGKKIKEKLGQLGIKL